LFLAGPGLRLDLGIQAFQRAGGDVAELIEQETSAGQDDRGGAGAAGVLGRIAGAADFFVQQVFLLDGTDRYCRFEAGCLGGEFAGGDDGAGGEGGGAVEGFAHAAVDPIAGGAGAIVEGAGGSVGDLAAGDGEQRLLQAGQSGAVDAEFDHAQTPETKNARLRFGAERAIRVTIEIQWHVSEAFEKRYFK
jgi:hypothetical protein